MLLGAIVLLCPTRAAAHFKIQDPTTPPKAATVQSWQTQDSVGGPQKNGPCGAIPNTALGDSAGTPVANSLTVVQPGTTVNVPVTATVAHPGWYRISLAEGASSGQTLTALPDPKAQSGTNCTPAIMSNPVWSTTQPVLADGLPAGSTASTNQSGSKTFQVTIPSTASCSTAQPCSLQVVMIMTDHPANDCYYHHCADVAVSSGGGSSGSGSGGATATGGAGGKGQGGSTGGGSGGSTGSGGSGNSGGSPGTGGSTTTSSGGSPSTGGSTATSSGGSPGTGGSTVTSSGGSPGSGGRGGSGGSETGGNGASSSGGAGGSGPSTGTGGVSGGTGQSGGSAGCSCTVAGHSQGFWAFGAVGVLALVIARRRRR
jgi:MYXO-CTERM domain-containing protein